METAKNIASALLLNAEKALTALLQVDSYLYWPYVITTLAIAFIVDRVSFFDKQLWLSQSSLVDYKLYFSNALLIPPIYAWVILSEGSVVSSLNLFFSAYLGQAKLPNFGAPSAWYLRAFFTVCVFIAYDLGRFIGHWLLHNSPVLWELHKVHHSATSLTPFTSYRVHPFEPILINLVCVVTTGFTVWLFHHSVGTGVSVYVFFGTHVVLAALNFVDNLRHSPVWITYGTFLNQWLISPAHHQLHHSLEDRHLGCNLGSTLAIWDRLNGTLLAPTLQKETFRMGLPDGENPPNDNLWAIYFGALRSALKHIAPAKQVSA